MFILSVIKVVVVVVVKWQAAVRSGKCFDYTANLRYNFMQFKIAINI